jgi:hypothetical protein
VSSSYLFTITVGKVSEEDRRKIVFCFKMASEESPSKILGDNQEPKDVQDSNETEPKVN